MCLVFGREKRVDFLTWKRRKKSVRENRKTIYETKIKEIKQIIMNEN